MAITLDGTSGIVATGSLTGLTTPLAVNQGGTGLTAPGTSGNVLTSDGTNWTSSALPAGGVTSLNGQTGAITNTDLYAIGSYVIGRPANATAYSVNTTVAGSSLYATDTTNTQWSGGWNTNAGQTLVNTGTWRCVSPAFGSGVNAWSGLWVRIS